MQRQIDDENKGGKIAIISNKMGQAIRNETTMGGDWDNLVVSAIPLLSVLCIVAPAN